MFFFPFCGNTHTCPLAFIHRFQWFFAHYSLFNQHFRVKLDIYQVYRNELGQYFFYSMSSIILDKEEYVESLQSRNIENIRSSPFLNVRLHLLHDQRLFSCNSQFIKSFIQLHERFNTISRLFLHAELMKSIIPPRNCYATPKARKTASHFDGGNWFPDSAKKLPHFAILISQFFVSVSHIS